MRRYILGGLISCFLCAQAFGITLFPTVIELNTDHRATSQLVVTNNSTRDLPLEANVRRLKFLPDGTFQTSDLSSEVMFVFPPAAMLAPGERQVFRIQWLGNRSLETSQSYFVRFSTVNIGQNNGKVDSPTSLTTGINLQVHYNALLHIHSSSLEPDVNLHIDEQGKLTLTNSGSRFTYTSLLHFKGLESQNQKVHEALGEQFIPPRSTITLPSSLNHLPVGTYHGYEN
ncbi:molecular chaperone [Vibrio sp. SNU_ST1]|uniref:molecular chaperone n=1 Tax=Vibrio sp. SNU_ST1 TaxID=3064001 RepID=UPI00272C7905|nr:molecular chaperone [Vibrio sp. SNU_ST1]WKY60587.1 molecular chaperone [Vibrio sp. SNU_ST1]